MSVNTETPIHDLSICNAINIESISHENQYNFKELHRHNYYEVLFFFKGGGYQIIDFEKIPVKSYSCYIVKPRQIHLLKRNEEADGLLIQFNYEAILSEKTISNFTYLKSHIRSPVIFEALKKESDFFFPLLKEIQKIRNEKSTYYKEKTISLLSYLLYCLEELSNKNHRKTHKDKIVNTFSELVEIHLKSWNVKNYASELNISVKTLGNSIKKNYGLTPLKYINNILLINIKRDLILGELSHKQIAFNYGFDSPSNFSLFVKKNSNLTPTQLQKKLISSI